MRETRWPFIAGVMTPLTCLAWLSFSILVDTIASASSAPPSQDLLSLRPCPPAAMFDLAKEIHMSTLKHRFEAKYVRSGPDDCWLWTAHIGADGYGIIRDSGGIRPMLKAHRVAWILTHGPIPVGEGAHGMCVLHKCDIKPCVNPRHLFLGSHADNMADMARKDRSGRHSHWGEAHGGVKLTDTDVVVIRGAGRNMLNRELAEIFDVHEGTISAIKRGDSRTRVTGGGRW